MLTSAEATMLKMLMYTHGAKKIAALLELEGEERELLNWANMSKSPTREQLARLRQLPSELAANNTPMATSVAA